MIYKLLGITLIASWLYTPFAMAESTINTAPNVKLTTQQSELAQSVLLIFQGKVTPTILSNWAEDAVFEDPFAHAVGRRQWSAQFYGLGQLFYTETPSHRVTLAEDNKLEMELTVNYAMKALPKLVKWKVDGVIYVETRASDGKVIKLEDRWYGKLLSEKFSSFRNFLRRKNAQFFPVFISVPTVPVEHTEL